MTSEERKQAINIIDEYRDLNNDIEVIVKSLDTLTEKKEELMKRLQDLKDRESNFMKDYKNKYGNRDLIADLNLEVL